MWLCILILNFKLLFKDDPVFYFSLPYQIGSSQTPVLIKNNQSYSFYCSILSYPCANITIYDTATMKQLSNANNSWSYSSSYQLYCYSSISVNFRFTDDTFDNMTSITCAANSINPQVSFSNSTISKNVLVLLRGKWIWIE